VTPILTITLNPALDISTSVHEVIPGPKLRCAVPQVDPGGGGINVSRAIAALGGSSHALVALGGTTGQRLASRVISEGILLDAFPGPGETRQSLAVTDSQTGQQYRFLLPGSEWVASQVEAVQERISEATMGGGFVVLSGSQPPGIPTDFARTLAMRLNGRARFVVDTSGPALRRLTEAPVSGIEVLRMDGEEAEDLAGHPLETRKDTADFAAALVARGGAKAVIVARGADGSVLVDAGKRLFSKAAKVPVKSKVGAGDSFVGGFVLALSQGDTTENALARGVAAASAAVMTEATELCHRADAERLIAECVVSEI